MSTTCAALSEGNVAVITGAASGIGLAAACHLAKIGMRIVMVDADEDALKLSAKDVVVPLNAYGDEGVLTLQADVSSLEQVSKVKEKAYSTYGQVNVLMNNAGIAPPAGTWSEPDAWGQILSVNLGGIINGVQAFTQSMLEQNTPGMIVNTGSKQGITCPPGNAAYNTSKAAVKSMTESLAHSLRCEENSQITAHLLVPGFVYTGMISKFVPEKPPGAWTPEETVSYMVSKLEEGEFYIICPDNETTEEMDKKRIAWSAQDIVQNRPALSRWHPDYADVFSKYMAE